MSKKLSPAQRKQIISDYKNGIQNEEYRVIDRGNGTYQVRKRDSKFILPPRPQTPAPKIEPEPEEEEEKKETPVRMSNEELLYKLSNLLQVPVKEPEELPEEHDHEEEAYEEDKQMIQRAATQQMHPWERKRFSLF